MSIPFVFITTHRVRPGQMERFKALNAEYLALTEAQEPRMRAHCTYLSDDGDEVSLVQIHPDADSAEHHLEVVAPRLAAAAELVENVAIEVFGEPGPRVRGALAHNAEAGVAVRVNSRDLGGFSRA